jgi:hypothetical protein
MYTPITVCMEEAFVIRLATILKYGSSIVDSTYITVPGWN